MFAFNAKELPPDFHIVLASAERLFIPTLSENALLLYTCRLEDILACQMAPHIFQFENGTCYCIIPVIKVGPWGRSRNLSEWAYSVWIWKSGKFQDDLLLWGHASAPFFINAPQPFAKYSMQEGAITRLHPNAIQANLACQTITKIYEWLFTEKAFLRTFPCWKQLEVLIHESTMVH